VDAARNFRFKRQTGGYGVFAGVTAEAVRATCPPAGVDRVGDRLWLDASRVIEGFRGTPLTLNRDEIGWLRTGLSRVAADIAGAETAAHVIVVVHAVEIVEVDYAELALAPAIAGWAAEEFGFPNRAGISLDQQTGRHVLTWSA
jgi:hypothetical protein